MPSRPTWQQPRHLPWCGIADGWNTHLRCVLAVFFSVRLCIHQQAEGHGRVHSHVPYARTSAHSAELQQRELGLLDGRAASPPVDSSSSLCEDYVEGVETQGVVSPPTGCCRGCSIPIGRPEFLREEEGKGGSRERDFNVCNSMHVAQKLPKELLTILDETLQIF